MPQIHVNMCSLMRKKTHNRPNRRPANSKTFICRAYERISSNIEECIDRKYEDKSESNSNWVEEDKKLLLFSMKRMDAADFITIIKYAWMEYDASRKVKSITDISAMVSTNHVYKIILEDRHFIIAKLSYFGKYDDFVEDHSIINVLSNNLPYPFENVLSRSLMKGE